MDSHEYHNIGLARGRCDCQAALASTRWIRSTKASRSPTTATDTILSPEFGVDGNTTYRYEMSAMGWSLGCRSPIWRCRTTSWRCGITPFSDRFGSKSQGPQYHVISIRLYVTRYPMRRRSSVCRRRFTLEKKGRASTRVRLFQAAMMP